MQSTIPYYSKVITDLEKLYNECESKIDSIKTLDKGDVRLGFYYLIWQTIDAAIHLLMFNTHLLSEQKEVIPFYSQFHIKNRFESNTPFQPKDIQIIICQFISNQYSIAIYSAFESSIRTIVRKKNYGEYDKRKNDIKGLVVYLMQDSKNYNQFYQIIENKLSAYIKIRNSVHNNGVFFPTQRKQAGLKKSSSILLDDDATEFNYGQVIRGGNVWDIHIQMSKDFFSIFNEIMEIEDIKNIGFIADPSN